MKGLVDLGRVEQPGVEPGRLPADRTFGDLTIALTRPYAVSELIIECYEATVRI